MIAYLVYDKKDIDRNNSFIKWFIDEGKKLKIDILLITSDDTFEELALPNFVINRSRDYLVSEYYESNHINVFNSSSVTRITNDKYETYKYLASKLPMLDTYELVDVPHFYPCIVKSVDGHGGNEVYYVEDEKDLPKESNRYIYQDIADKLGRDLRVFIIGNEIIASVIRTNETSFKSNYSLGGNIELYELSNNERVLINKVIDNFSFDYVGIDFLFDENNNLILNEIEDAVGSRMLSELTDLNVVSLYLNHIVDSI